MTARGTGVAFFPHGSGFREKNGQERTARNRRNHANPARIGRECAGGANLRLLGGQEAGLIADVRGEVRPEMPFARRKGPLWREDANPEGEKAPSTSQSKWGGVIQMFCTGG